jgi:hypothetical protein
MDYSLFTLAVNDMNNKDEGKGGPLLLKIFFIIVVRSCTANENKIERIAKTSNICVVRVAISLLLFKIRKTNV